MGMISNTRCEASSVLISYTFDLSNKIVIKLICDKVWVYEEIMTNDDNLESNLLTSSLLRMLVQVLLQVELEICVEEEVQVGDDWRATD